jgi:hypothetical protein
MDDLPDPQEITFALQKHPETLVAVLGRMVESTLGQWEQLGKLVYRRRIDGTVVVWSMEGSDGYWHTTLEHKGSKQWRMSVLGDVMAEVDLYLRGEGWLLLDDVVFPSPVTETMVWRAAGLERPDLFAIRATLRTVRDHQRASANPSTSLPHDVARHSGRSTEVLVRALTTALNGRPVVVVVSEDNRVGHLCSLLRTMTRSFKCVVEEPIPHGFSMRVSEGRVRLLPVGQLERLWNKPGSGARALLHNPKTRFLFDWA